MIIVFSKDRAFQLEACLRTLLEQCLDAAEVPIRILWTASTSEHRRAYALLPTLYSAFPNLRFVEESGFRSDLIALLGNLSMDSVGAHWIRRLPRFLTALVLRPAPIVLFVVDDTLFLRPFRFRECAELLRAADDCLAFSLRLGRNLTRFYMGHREQIVPEFVALDSVSGISKLRWTDADGDFAYPLEISSSLLKVDTIFARLLRKDWRSPNTLEFALAGMAGRYKESYPWLLTYEEPRAVAVPLNMVQQDFTSNRFGGLPAHQPDSLCRLFLRGGRADLSGLRETQHNAVHVEIDLLPARDHPHA
jgi:hypothetical protein